MDIKQLQITSRKWMMVLVIQLVLPLGIHGQVDLEETRLINAVQSSPQEKAFVHYNSTFLLAGENLYYKFYLINTQSAAQDPLSRIAYVELQGKDGVTIFRHKVNLESGAGKGDFFIPTTVPSGNYRLIGYTRWMLNGDQKNVFEGDLVIVNPYLKEQQNLQASSEVGSPELLEKPVIPASREFTGNVSGSEAREYGKRTLVSLGREEFQGLEPGGNYSVSVRRKSGIEVPKMLNSEGVFRAETGSSQRISGTEIQLPELRGEIFTGQIMPGQGHEAASLNGRSVALSIPGEDFILKISRTNEEGKFIFIVENYNNGDDVSLQVLGEDREIFDIELDALPKAEATAFPDFQLSPQMEEILVEESIYNQIENGYLAVKPDTLQQAENDLPFYGDLMLTYNLNDYTRFETLKEVLVEIVRDISVRRNSGGEYLKTRGENALVDSEMSSLLIVDDIVVQDHELLINYPAKMIHSIGVLRQKYFYGPEVFHGIIHVKTTDGNFLNRLNKDYLHTKELLRPNQEKSYFKQTYAKAGDKTRIPDFRRQLLWDPELNFSNGDLEFYTSDVPGVYEIVVQGFSNAGEPVSISKNIRVR